jgi:hypothetical protein
LPQIDLSLSEGKRPTDKGAKVKTKYSTLTRAKNAINRLNRTSDNGQWFYTYNGTDFDIYWVPNQKTVLASK